MRRKKFYTYYCHQIDYRTMAAYSGGPYVAAVVDSTHGEDEVWLLRDLQNTTVPTPMPEGSKRDYLLYLTSQLRKGQQIRVVAFSSRMIRESVVLDALRRADRASARAL